MAGSSSGSSFAGKDLPCAHDGRDVARRGPGSPRRDGSSATPAPRAAGDRQRAACDPRDRAGSDRRLAARRHSCTRPRVASPPCSPAASPARRCCCAATWMRCRCTRTPGSTSARAATARCTPAGTTPTWRCWPVRPGCCRHARDEIPGRVLFMFQPGEEGHHGARFMLDEGLLDVPPLADGTPSPVTGAFALHITSTLPTGWVSSRGGPIMASADRFHHRCGRPRRPRQRAVPGPRPDPDRVRDRAGDADDGHSKRRRVRPGGGDRRSHHAPARRTTSSPRRPRSKARSARSASRPARRCTTTSGASPKGSPRPTEPT